MLRRLLRLLPLLAVLLLLTATPALAITNGQPDGNGHPYVGIVYNTRYFCTGSLIAPTVFLTAGHCTDEFARDEAEGDQTYVLFDPQPVPNELLTDPWFVTSVSRSAWISAAVRCGF